MALFARPGRREADVAQYRPLSGRRRLLIAALAVATAVWVLWLMLQPQLRKMRAEAARKGADVQACSGQQTQGCVGGTMGVITAPAAPGSAPR